MLWNQWLKKYGTDEELVTAWDRPPRSQSANFVRNGDFDKGKAE